MTGPPRSTLRARHAMREACKRDPESCRFRGPKRQDLGPRFGIRPGTPCVGTRSGVQPRVEVLPAHGRSVTLVLLHHDRGPYEEHLETRRLRCTQPWRAQPGRLPEHRQPKRVCGQCADDQRFRWNGPRGRRARRGAGGHIVFGAPGHGRAPARHHDARAKGGPALPRYARAAHRRIQSHRRRQQDRARPARDSCWRPRVLQAKHRRDDPDARPHLRHARALLCSGRRNRPVPRRRRGRRAACRARCQLRRLRC